MYYELTCRPAIGMLFPMFTYRPEKPGTSWLLGRPHPTEVSEPIPVTCQDRPKQVWPVYVKAPLPMLRRTFHDFFQAEGVASYRAYQVSVRDEKTKKPFDVDYVAINFLRRWDALPPTVEDPGQALFLNCKMDFYVHERLVKKMIGDTRFPHVHLIPVK